MRAWVRLALRLSERWLGLSPRRVGRDILLERLGVPVSERSDAIAEYLHDQVLRRLLEVTRPDVLVDVGANRGQFGLRARALGYLGRIVSIEPLPDAFASLSQTAEKDGAWSCLHTAVAEVDGTAVFHVTPSEQFSSLLPRSTYSAERFGDQTTDSSTMEVPVRRLDGLLLRAIPDIGKCRVFLKLDTQGYDVRAFRSMGTLQSAIVMLQSEVAVVPIYQEVPGFLDALEEFESSGLRTVDLFPVARDQAGVGTIEFDCLMWRPAGA